MTTLPPSRRRPLADLVPLASPLAPSLVLASALALGGCASAVPAVDGPTLSVAEARAAVPAEPLEVRWGGTIAAVHNTAEGTTELEIVSRPLRAGGRPRTGDTTDGRFLAEIDAFLDPEIVKSGRDVTVTGRVAGRREGKIGETPYVYPVVEVDGYRYWKPEVQQAYFPHYPFTDPYGDFGYGWPYRHPYPRSGVSIGGGVSF